MTDRLTCIACGHEGFDVSSRLVEVNSDRPVRIQGTTDVYTVPERYRVELRCVDKEACRDREEANHARV